MINSNFIQKQKKRLIYREDKYRNMLLSELNKNQALSLRTEQKINTSIPFIKKALSKIETGTYGYCDNEACGRKIPQRRLKAVPGAIFCLKCQKEREENNVIY